jgi:hypothetical protein
MTIVRSPIRNPGASAIGAKTAASACITGLLLALAAATVLAQGPTPARPIARLTGLQGNVLVSQADGMAAAVEGQQLAPGVRVITTAGSKVTIAYDRGCLIDLGENRRYMVREAAECVAAKPPSLGAATPYAVLAGPEVVNSGTSVVRGDVGVSPGVRVTGFPGGKGVDGTIQPSGDGPSLAQKDAAAAYADLASQQCNFRLAGQDLGGQTLSPAVYCFPGASARLTGELVLDAQGDPDAVFVFQVGTTLTTAAKSSVRVINSGQAADQGAGTPVSGRRDSLCHVYWQVGDSAAIGRDSTFIGSIIALRGIGVAANAAIYGRALARTGAITMDTDDVELPSCALAVAAATGGAGVGTLIGFGVPLAAAAGVAIVNAVRKAKSPS